MGTGAGLLVAWGLEHVQNHFKDYSPKSLCLLVEDCGAGARRMSGQGLIRGFWKGPTSAKQASVVF